MNALSQTGPLEGLRVVEMAGIGPGPFAAKFLAEMGADVVRIDRPGGNGWFTGLEHKDQLNRGKRSVLLDLHEGGDRATARWLIERADVLIEGYRPGVMERVGLGPDTFSATNPGLIYGRMTGWGQDGPLAPAAGHDIDYVAITGLLDAIGQAGGPPVVPLNVAGDFGGGGAYLVIGVLAALHERTRSGTGQVVDAAIVDGAAHLLNGVHAMLAVGGWPGSRGENLLDGGAPFYGVYRTSDDRYMAVGALEPKFYAALLEGLGLDLDRSTQNDPRTWADLKEALAARFLTRTQDEWCAVFGGTDACVAPVAGLRAAIAHPHIAARRTLLDVDGVLQAAPAPRFGRTRSALGGTPPIPGADNAAVLADWGAGTSQHDPHGRNHITDPMRNHL